MEHEGEYIGYIYCITNNNTGKKYIGQTSVSIKSRYNGHKKQSRYGDESILHQSMRKHGFDAFDVKEVEEVRCDTFTGLKDLLNEREAFYVSEYKTLWPDGYNMTPGGNQIIPKYKTILEVDEFGRILNEFDSYIDIINKYGINKGTLNSALNSKTHYSCGRYWYYKNDVNIDDNNIGPQYTPHQKHVFQYNRDMELIAEYDSITEASESTGVSIASISQACYDSYKKPGGFYWSFEFQTPRCEILRVDPRCKFLYAFDLDWNFKLAFYSAKSAAYYFGIDKSAISHSIKHGSGIVKGYRWSYDRYPNKEVD